MQDKHRGSILSAINHLECYVNCTIKILRLGGKQKMRLEGSLLAMLEWALSLETPG
jgi:hypothetical protein